MRLKSSGALHRLIVWPYVTRQSCFRAHADHFVGAQNAQPLLKSNIGFKGVIGFGAVI
jgi:ATP adenylyltransferase/5',5'''-P-1,P-4-tetraphosphate phosphorylase II